MKITVDNYDKIDIVKHLQNLTKKALEKKADQVSTQIYPSKKATKIVLQEFLKDAWKFDQNFPNMSGEGISAYGYKRTGNMLKRIIHLRRDGIKKSDVIELPKGFRVQLHIPPDIDWDGDNHTVVRQGYAYAHELNTDTVFFKRYNGYKLKIRKMYEANFRQILTQNFASKYH